MALVQKNTTLGQYHPESRPTFHAGQGVWVASTQACAEGKAIGIYPGGQHKQTMQSLSLLLPYIW